MQKDKKVPKKREKKGKGLNTNQCPMYGNELQFCV